MLDSATWGGAPPPPWALHAVCDRVAALADGKVIAEGTMETMLASEHPWLKAYFRGKRARAVIPQPALG
jgi:phospholipid/cholesterol/gamma-HCH transport system ATP-binding protein